MALTSGTGPFASHPAGRFDVDPPGRPLLFWERFPKRLRVVIGGRTIVDSDRVLALHETGELMRLCVPWDDVQRHHLTPRSSADHHRLGSLRCWSFGSVDEGVTTLLRSIDAPPGPAADLKDHVVVDLARADAWYLEDDLGYAHPRDPYHRVDVQRSSRRAVVSVGQTIVADTPAAAMLFETGLPPRFYLPPDAVRPGFLVESETVSQCPYKGDGQHWHLTVDGHRIADAAWNLTTPMGDALMIPRWFSFYPGKVTIDVDGQPIGR